MENTLDKQFLLNEIKDRLHSLEQQASKYRKGRDGHNLHKIKARKDELYRLRKFIEDGLFDNGVEDES